MAGPEEKRGRGRPRKALGKRQARSLRLPVQLDWELTQYALAENNRRKELGENSVSLNDIIVEVLANWWGNHERRDYFGKLYRAHVKESRRRDRPRR